MAHKTQETGKLHSDEMERNSVWSEKCTGSYRQLGMGMCETLHPPFHALVSSTQTSFCSMLSCSYYSSYSPSSTVFPLPTPAVIKSLWSQLKLWVGQFFFHLNQCYGAGSTIPFYRCDHRFRAVSGSLLWQSTLGSGDQN